MKERMETDLIKVMLTMPKVYVDKLDQQRGVLGRSEYVRRLLDGFPVSDTTIPKGVKNVDFDEKHID